MELHKIHKEYYPIVRSFVHFEYDPGDVVDENFLVVSGETVLKREFTDCIALAYVRPTAYDNDIDAPTIEYSFDMDVKEVLTNGSYGETLDSVIFTASQGGIFEKV